MALIANDGSGPLGGEQCIDITVNDFIALRAFQFSMAWDSTKFKFSRITNIHPDFEGVIDFGVPGMSQIVNEGQITVVWADFSGVTIPNDAVLFTLCLRGEGVDCGDQTDVSFTGDPTPIIFADSDGQIPNSEITFVSGILSVSCGPDISSIILNHPPCNGDETGSIDITVLPANGNFEYSWNTTPPVMTQDLSGVGAGSYTVTIIDVDNNITIMETYTLIEPPAIQIFGSSTDETMAGNDGSITIDSLTGGTGVLNCMWTPNISSDCTGATDLAPGSYTLKVTDENDCMVSRTFVIMPFVNPNLSVTLQIDDATCAESDGDCNGSIDVIANGTGPFVYTLDDVNFDGSQTDVCAGTHTIMVTDEGNNMTFDYDNNDK